MVIGLLFLLFASAVNVNAQSDSHNKGIYWTIEPSQVFGFGNVNYSGISTPYRATSVALSTTIGYALDEQNSLGVGQWVNAFSASADDNLTMPFYIEYTRALKQEDKSPYLLARLGNSFSFGQSSEVEDGLHFSFRFGYRKLNFTKRFNLNPFFGVVFQQVKDDEAIVPIPGGQPARVIDNVMFTAVQVGLTLYIIK